MCQIILEYRSDFDVVLCVCLFICTCVHCLNVAGVGGIGFLVI
jgi:hypothetical protein